MDKYYLRFKDNKLNQYFETYHRNKFQSVFYIYSLYYFFVYIINIIDNYFLNVANSFELMGLIRLIQLFVSLSVFLLIRHRSYNYQAYFIIFMGIVNGIISLERFNYYQITKIGCFLEGFAFTLHAAIPQFILDYSYISRLFFAIVLLIYIKIRVEEVTLGIFSLGLFFVSLIFLLLYIIQKRKMEMFNKNYQNQVQLEQVKNILYEHVPFSILILSKNSQQKTNDQCAFKICFTNSKFIQLLKIQCTGIQPNEEYNEIYLNENKQSFDGFLNQQMLQSLTIKVQKIKSQCSCQISFYQFINQFFSNNENDVNNSYYLQFIRDNNNNSSAIVQEEYQKTYKLQVADCMWENDQAKMIIIKNFTKQKQVSALLQINEYKDDILATVSHDLKTPINGIVAQIDSINNQSPHEDIIKVLEIIKINIKLLLYLVYDIQDYSQIIKQKIKILPITFNIAEVVQESLQLIEFQAKIKNIEIQHNMKDLALFRVFNDPIRLKQILLNLLSNALKCTRTGFIKTNICILENNLLQISIEDSGKGMTQEQLNGLFKKFNSYCSDKKQHGVGLGLSITKHLIELMGPDGKIQVTSEVNKGTCFSFQIYQNIQISNKHVKSQNCIQFSIKKYSSQYSKNEFSSPEIGIEFKSSSEIYGFNEIYQGQYKIKNDLNKVNKDKLKVLIVDDDVFCILAFKTLCQHYPQFLIKEAYNGQEAVDKVKQQFYDIIFIDVNMPDMDGIQAATLIKKQYQNCIIVFLSGNNEDFLKNQYIDFQYLSVNKPIDKDKFVKLLGEINAIISK